MGKNKFLKLMSIVLAGSTLSSSFFVEPVHAEPLSKKAKIGIGVGVPAVLVSAGLLLTWCLWPRGKNNPNEKTDGVFGNGWAMLKDAEKRVVEDFHKSLGSSPEGMDEKVIKFVEDKYPDLVKELSGFDFDKDSSVQNILIIFGKDATCYLPKSDKQKFEYGINRLAEYLRVVRDRSTLSGYVLPKLTIKFNVDPSEASMPSEITDDYSNAESIRQTLIKRSGALKDHLNPATKKRFNNNWEQLCYLLGNQANIDWVNKNYPEWSDRLQGKYKDIIQGDGKGEYKGCKDYENFALMSIAYSLLLAKSENYRADDPKNNELLVGCMGKPKNVVAPTSDAEKAELRKKIKILGEDFLECTQNHFDDKKLFRANWCFRDKEIGFLNAGDPYDPNGFLPNHGMALEEYLSMNTTLVRDLSHKAFRKPNGRWGKNGFYTNRGEYPPVVGWNEAYTSQAFERLSGTGAYKDSHRDFYHERGIMSRNVHLIRPLGSAVWQHPINQFGNFDVSSDGFSKKTFCVLSIAGIEDRSLSGIKDLQCQLKWKEITKKQCRFALEAFIREGVQVPFLCPFSAGAFGGSATIVAECFKELLIDEGYAAAFDGVIFPITGGNDPLQPYSAAEIADKPILSRFRGKPNIEGFLKVFGPNPV